MVISLKQEDLQKLLEDEITTLQQIGGGANMYAYEFDPYKEPVVNLMTAGYFNSPEAWIAGIRIKKLIEFANEHGVTLFSR